MMESGLIGKFAFGTLNLLNSDEAMSNSVIRHGNVRFVSLRLIFPMGADIRDIIETWLVIMLGWDPCICIHFNCTTYHHHGLLFPLSGLLIKHSLKLTRHTFIHWFQLLASHHD